jgi:broad specificity phosphatase PhoE
MIKILFESHATTVDNEAKLASGWNDIELSQLGLEQCKDLLERYRNEKIDAIFTSDLQRAYKTAVPTAEELKIPIYVDRRLRECDYGDLTQKGKHIVEEQKAERIKVPFPNGESYEQCMERMESFLEWLKENFEGKRVMVIGHRATQYGLEHHIRGKDVKTCVTEPWSWQPGWEYELE